LLNLPERRFPGQPSSTGGEGGRGTSRAKGEGDRPSRHDG
jgi:hypothetical protein